MSRVVMDHTSEEWKRGQRRAFKLLAAQKGELQQSELGRILGEILDSEDQVQELANLIAALVFIGGFAIDRLSGSRDFTQWLRDFEGLFDEAVRRRSEDVG